MKTFESTMEEIYASMKKEGPKCEVWCANYLKENGFRSFGVVEFAEALEAYRFYTGAK